MITKLSSSAQEARDEREGQQGQHQHCESTPITIGQYRCSASGE